MLRRGWHDQIVGESRERYSRYQAVDAITDRVSKGDRVLSLQGFWVRDGKTRPEFDCSANFAPDGLWNLEVISSILERWPNSTELLIEATYSTQM